MHIFRYAFRLDWTRLAEIRYVNSVGPQEGFRQVGLFRNQRHIVPFQPCFVLRQASLDLQCEH